MGLSLTTRQSLGLRRNRYVLSRLCASLGDTRVPSGTRLRGFGAAFLAFRCEGAPDLGPRNWYALALPPPGANRLPLHSLSCIASVRPQASNAYHVAFGPSPIRAKILSRNRVRNSFGESHTM